MGDADDAEIWSFAATNDFVIVSKDFDFHHRSFLLGAPPKVVWLSLGNCTTAKVESTLRMNTRAINLFGDSIEQALLVLP
jgi:predicted nuclease of predicted toxin-antitoxin system